jgi:LuxR family maltose regulon positive regulatory protein
MFQLKLTNDLAALPDDSLGCTDFILVLDDYHTIRIPAIHDQMSQLVRYMPPWIRLVLITRAAPPFWRIPPLYLYFRDAYHSTQR